MRLDIVNLSAHGNDLFLLGGRGFLFAFVKKGLILVLGAFHKVIYLHEDTFFKIILFERDVIEEIVVQER